jgi:hypothetical protein
MILTATHIFSEAQRVEARKSRKALEEDERRFIALGSEARDALGANYTLERRAIVASEEERDRRRLGASSACARQQINELWIKVRGRGRTIK